MMRPIGTALASSVIVAGAWSAGASAQLPDSAATVVVPEAADSTVRVQPLPGEAAAHLGHITTAFGDTPGGMGLIHAGVAEAAIAPHYVRLAGRDSLSLVGMSRPMASVIHAIDPSQASGGPGLGYGVKRAAAAVGTHAALAASVPGLSPQAQFHIAYVERAAAGSARRADEAIALARQVQRAPNAAAGRRLLRELAQAVRGMAYGEDRDTDGRIGYADDEVGLAQGMYHLQLLYRIEGLTPPPPLR